MRRWENGLGSKVGAEETMLKRRLKAKGRKVFKGIMRGVLEMECKVGRDTWIVLSLVEAESIPS